MPSRPTYFRARHVATMTEAGVIDDGCVAVLDGRIVAVGSTRDLNPPHVDVDHPGLLTPGLINVHTHLELTNVPRPPTPGTFQNWLLTTMGSMRTPDLATFERDRADAVRAGIDQCLKFGVTCVDDISQNVNVVRPILAKGPIRSTSYGECLGLGPRRQRFETLLRQALRTWPGDRMRIGISPHAPYTVDAAGFLESFSAARGAGLHVATHLAETPDEAAFVFERKGPFMQLYNALGFDPGPPDASEGTIIAWLTSLSLDEIGILAHVNYCTDADINSLAGTEAIVAYCPRTHAYFGHPPHRWRDMIVRGINVCVATDSCASSPDLNLMDDLRLLRLHAPDVPPQRLWEMITIRAATRSDFGHGRIRNGVLLASDGKDAVAADLVAWPTVTDDPLAEVLDTAGMLPSGVWIAGERVAGPF